jgi:prevent-host-death family protein
MISAGIKELKNNLSRYLSKVKKGEDILVTERGNVIARIVREDAQNRALRKALRPLIMKGLLTLPTQHVDKDVPQPLNVSGKPISEMVIEDRR